MSYMLCFSLKGYGFGVLTHRSCWLAACCRSIWPVTAISRCRPILLNNLIGTAVAGKEIELLRWLSCIFMPQPVQRNLVERRKSCRVEDSVPEGVKHGIRKFNEFVHRRYVAYAVGVSSMHSCCLPLSGIQVGSKISDAITCSVSLFARTSGLTSTSLNSIDRLTYCIRPELIADHSSIPVVPELGSTYSCFLVDFYKMECPSIDVIVIENGLKAAWDHINSFSSILQILTTSLSLANGPR